MAQGRTPPGLNNDVAEEALRAIYLVQDIHFEVITFAVGRSAETLYLYPVGGMIQLFGRSILPIQLVSWILRALLRRHPGRSAHSLDSQSDLLSRAAWRLPLPGSYVLRGTGGDWVVNMIRAAFMPFYYPESYLRNGNFDFDRVSAALTLSGFNSVHPVLAIALIVGLTRVKRWIARPVAAYLVAVWLTAIPTLGFAGPSLTRLLILCPSIWCSPRWELALFSRNAPPCGFPCSW